jgi:hypothetical protein
MRADQVRVGDGILSRGGLYSPVRAITSERTLAYGWDALGRWRILRRPILLFDLANGMRDGEWPDTLCDVLAVGR